MISRFPWEEKPRLVKFEGKKNILEMYPFGPCIWACKLVKGWGNIAASMNAESVQTQWPCNTTLSTGKIFTHLHEKSYSFPLQLCENMKTPQIPTSRWIGKQNIQWRVAVKHNKFELLETMWMDINKYGWPEKVNYDMIYIIWCYLCEVT